MGTKGVVYYYEISPLAHGGVGDFSFTYASDIELAVGSFVTVPFGRRTSLGVVMSSTTQPEFTTRPIEEIHESLPVLSSETLELAAWLAGYYLASAKAVWQTLLPSGLTTKSRATKPKAKSDFKAPTSDHPLTKEQSDALEKLRQNQSGKFLLQGITGSGKTRLYIERARDMLTKGKSSIILVPEISLTPQLVSQFEQTFGNQVLSQHSRLTPAQRRKIWLQAAASQDPVIAIGPRSTLFLPLPNPGLIIIDEEHDSSYKQAQAPRYQAITAASKLASLVNAQLVLGSATPSLQEVYLAREERLTTLELTERASGQPLPKTHIIDLRDKSLMRRSKFLSQPLLEALDYTLAQGRQSLLFINRRGSASSYLCGDCGEVRSCPTCHIPLTFHADHMQLICHYCNYSEKPLAICQACGASTMNFLGGGTKRIETELAKLLPTARVARLDKDNNSLENIESIHAGMHNGSIDILVGTQMVTKGLDISGLDLVGVISADTALHFPDFSAAERTFQIISQVIGRAGRSQQPGQAYIQTYTPEHPAIVAAASHAFTSFADTELAERHLLNYPPYVFLLKIQCSLSSAAAAKHKAQAAFDLIKDQSGIQILGPAPAFAERLHGSYHWQLIIKSKSRAKLVEIAKMLPSGWTIDLDPINLL